MSMLNKFLGRFIWGRFTLMQLWLKYISFTLGAHLLVIFL